MKTQQSQTDTKYERKLDEDELARVDRLAQLTVELFGDIKVADLARLTGVGEKLLGLVLNRKRNLTERNARLISERTGKSFGWLYLGESNMIPSKHSVPLKLLPQEQRAAPRSIPLFGSTSMAFHGKILKGGASHGTVPAPYVLEDCPTAYAAFVPDDTMSPRYDPGEIVYVNPMKTAGVGSYVIIEFKAPQAGGQKYGIIRRLVGRSETEVIVEQLNPPERQSFPIDSVIAVDRIVQGGEG